MPGIGEPRQRAVNVGGLGEVGGGRGEEGGREGLAGLGQGRRLVLGGRQQLHGIGPYPVAELCESRVKPATSRRHGQHAGGGSE